MNALEGLKVVDLTSVVSGPYATSLLADLGADVIKVEAPGTGDIARVFEGTEPLYTLKGMTPHILTLARNKRSVVINLRTNDGRETFYDLARWADVVVDNYRPGVTERLKIDHDSLEQVQPGIITASITGYGQTGPGRDRAALDACIQAYSGVMSITGEPDGPPMRGGPLYADLCSGMAAAFGIVSAVVARQRTGKGQHLDLSMLDVQVSMLNYTATMSLISGIPTKRYGNQHPLHVPYDAYPTADGYLFVAAFLDNHWPALVEAMERHTWPPELQPALKVLKDPALLVRRARLERRDAINAALAKLLRQRTRQEWTRDFSAAGIPFAPVNTIEEAVSDPQVMARNMVVEIEHPLGGSYKATGNPIKLSDADDGTFTPPPLLGEHTVEVLRDVLGYDGERIGRLRASGAIVTAEMLDGRASHRE